MRTFVVMLIFTGTAPAAGLRVGLGRYPALPTSPRAPTPLMNGRFGFGKPPAPPKSSSETFLSSKPNNQELGGYFSLFAGALTFVAKYLDDDLQEKITGKIDSTFKPLAADVAAMKDNVAVLKTDISSIKTDVLPTMGTDISSIKTTVAMTSFNVGVLDFLLLAGLLFALYLKNEETKKMSDELSRLYQKKR